MSVWGLVVADGGVGVGAGDGGHGVCWRWCAAAGGFSRCCALAVVAGLGLRMLVG